MGLLSALLQWNEIDPPSRSEQLRNDRVCSLYQHNRNPFVDHPEFANLIWRNSPAKSPTLVRKSPKAWVNEFHYENKGKDVNEVHHPLIHHFFLQVFFFGFIKSPSSLFAHTNYILNTCKRDETLVSLNHHDEICCSS